jgi:hypothetical protein
MTAQDASKSHRLVLAFHGVYLFNIWPRFVEIIIPRIPHHMYLVEEPHKSGCRRYGLIDSATLTLNGVPGEAAPPKLDDTSSLVIRNHRLAGSHTETFCRLIVPFPKWIVPIRCTAAVDGPPLFDGPSASEVESTQKFPAGNIYVYEKVDPDTLSFGPDLPWMPEEDDQHCVHFRFYAERAMCGHSGTHVTHAFETLTSMVPDFMVSIREDKQFRSVSCGAAPPYAAPEDLQPLRVRLGMDCPDSDPPFDCGHLVVDNSGLG